MIDGTDRGQQAWNSGQLPSDPPGLGIGSNGQRLLSNGDSVVRLLTDSVGASKARQSETKVTTELGLPYIEPAEF